MFLGTVSIMEESRDHQNRDPLRRETEFWVEGDREIAEATSIVVLFICS